MCAFCSSCLSAIPCKICAVCSCLPAIPCKMRAFCWCLSAILCDNVHTLFVLFATPCTMCTFFYNPAVLTGLQKKHLASIHSAVCTGSKVYQNIQMSNRGKGGSWSTTTVYFSFRSHNALFLSLAAKCLIERDLSFFLHFFPVSTLKSVFGREDESAMLTRTRNLGRKVA